MSLENFSQFKDDLAAKERQVQEQESNKEELVDEQRVFELLSSVYDSLQGLEEKQRHKAIFMLIDLVSEYRMELASTQIDTKSELRTLAIGIQDTLEQISSQPDKLTLLDIHNLNQQRLDLEDKIGHLSNEISFKDEFLEALVLNRTDAISEMKAETKNHSIWKDFDTYINIPTLGLVSLIGDIHEPDVLTKLNSILERINLIDLKIKDANLALGELKRRKFYLSQKLAIAEFNFKSLVGIPVADQAFKVSSQFRDLTPEYISTAVDPKHRDFIDFISLEHTEGFSGKLSQYMKSVTAVEKQGRGGSLTLSKAAIHAEIVDAEFLASHADLGSVVQVKEGSVAGPSKRYARFCPEVRGLLAQGYKHRKISSNLVSNQLNPMQETLHSVLYRKAGQKIEYFVVGQERSKSQPGFRLISQSNLETVAIDNLLVDVQDFRVRESVLLELFNENHQLDFFTAGFINLNDGLNDLQNFLFESGFDGSQQMITGAKTQALVDYVKEKGGNLKQSLEQLKLMIPDMKDFVKEFAWIRDVSPKNDSLIQIESRLDQVEQSLKLLESRQLDKLCNVFLDDNLTADTLTSWFIKEGIVILSSIIVAVAAVLLAVPSGGTSLSLLGVSAVIAGGSLVGSELGYLVSDLVGEKVYGQDYDNLPIFLKADNWQEIVSAYGQQFAVQWVSTFALMGLGRLAGAQLTKFIGNNTMSDSLKGQVARSLAKVPRIGYTKVDLSQATGRGEFIKRYFTEVLEEVGDETAEALAAAVDKRLGFLVTLVLCTNSKNMRTHLDGKQVNLLSSFKDGNTMNSEFIYDVNEHITQEYLQQKFEGSIIGVDPNGCFVVSQSVVTKTGKKVHIMKFRSSAANVNFLSDLTPEYIKAYGLDLSQQANSDFSYKSLGPPRAGELSLLGYLQVNGYKISEFSETGFVASYQDTQISFHLASHSHVDKALPAMPVVLGQDTNVDSFGPDKTQALTFDFKPYADNIDGLEIDGIDYVIKDAGYVGAIIKALENRGFSVVKRDSGLLTTKGVFSQIIKIEDKTYRAYFESVYKKWLQNKTSEQVVSDFQDALKLFAVLKPQEVSSNVLVNILVDLRKDNPEAFELISQVQDKKLLVETQLFQDVLERRPVKRLTSQNGPFNAYFGKTAGSGGFGIQEYVLYKSPQTGDVTIACHKTWHQKISPQQVDKEIQGFVEANAWNDSGIIKLLEHGHNFLISETGGNALDMFSAMDKLQPVEWFSLYMKQLQVNKTFWKNGFFHGDMKAANVLTFVNNNGERVVKIIDLLPTRVFKSIQTFIDKHGVERGVWPHTYAFRGPAIKKARTFYSTQFKHDVNLQLQPMYSNYEIQTRIAKAHDIRGQGIALEQFIGHRIGGDLSKLTTAQQDVIVRANLIAKQATDIMEASKSDFMVRLEGITQELIKEFSTPPVASATVVKQAPTVVKQAPTVVDPAATVVDLAPTVPGPAPKQAATVVKQATRQAPKQARRKAPKQVTTVVKPPDK